MRDLQEGLLRNLLLESQFGRRNLNLSKSTFCVDNLYSCARLENHSIECAKYVYALKAEIGRKGAGHGSVLAKLLRLPFVVAKVLSSSYPGDIVSSGGDDGSDQ
jgi:hypothetical protein